MTNFDKEIAGAREILNDLQNQMELLKQQFISESTKVIRESYMKVADAEMKNQPDITLGLAENDLKRIRNEIRLLQQNAPQAVSEFLDSPDLWWHYLPKDQDYVFNGYMPPKELNKALCLALGKIAPILAEFKYVTLDPADSSAWLEYDETGNRHPWNARPICRNCEWTDRMKELMAIYKDTKADTEHKQHDVNELEREKKKSEAMDRWQLIKEQD